jgi:hypothetical protein
MRRAYARNVIAKTTLDARDATPMQLRILPIALLACLPIPSVSLSEPVDPAQAIAQKFYEADEPAPKPVAKRNDRPDHDYEEDMLRRAHAEEAEWQKQNTRHDVAPRPSTPVATVQPAFIQPKVTPDTATVYEEDMLRQARAEEAERQKQNKRDDIAAQPSTPVATVQPAFIQPKADPDAATVVAPRLIETIATTKPVVATPVVVTPQERADEPALPKLNEARATVLIVLDDDDYGLARIKPDPIICFDQQCWISNGLEAPAKPMPRSQAIALKTTDTPTGDSCSGKSGCAFRDIAFNPTTRVQVIEVGDSRGVSDGAYTITTDASCQKRDGGLACDNAVVTQAFRMWVVPEATAQAIGAIALENAVADGLPDNGDDDPTAGK